MEVYLTRHARNRMRLYAMVAEAVQAAAEQPECVTPAAFGASHAWKQISAGQWLRVTFVDERTRRVVITVTPKRQPPGGHDAH